MHACKIAIAAFALLIGAPAFAGDLGGQRSSLVPLGAVVANNPSWTGSYVSAGVGYSTTDVIGLELGEHITYTAGIGYDYHVPNTRLVAGIMADYTAPGEASGISDALNGSWYVGGRLGALLSDSLLAYGSAGYTGTDMSSGVPDDFEGLTLGAGAELLVTQHVSLKLDWRHINHGNVDGMMGGDLATLSTDEVRAFLSYRF